MFFIFNTFFFSIFEISWSNYYVLLESIILCIFSLFFYSQERISFAKTSKRQKYPYNSKYKLNHFLINCNNKDHNVHKAVHYINNDNVKNTLNCRSVKAISKPTNSRKMAFILFFPAVAALALFIVGVIILILRFGPRLCGLRHHALPDNHEWDEKSYEHEISYA